MTRARHSGECRNPVTEHLDLWTSALLVKSTAGRGSNGRLEAYGIKKLRELILELAVRGRLVPQDANEDPASLLIKNIAVERVRQLKEVGGKIKGGRKIDNDEIPYQLPNGWEWVRLGSYVYLEMGQSPPSDFYNQEKNGLPFFQGKADFGDIYPTPRYWCTKPQKHSYPGDVLLSVRAPVGPTNISNIKCCIGRGLAALRPMAEASTQFLLILMRAFERKLASFATGTTFSAVSRSDIESLVICVPPLAEQHRIVAKVDELMALCDQLEQQQGRGIEAHQTLVETLLGTLTSVESAREFAAAWNRIAEHFDTLFTTEHSIDQLKQTILQLAVMGKLVPQDSRDGNASELLRRTASVRRRLIEEGEIRQTKSPMFPVDAPERRLPNNWIWTNLFEIGEIAPRNEEDDAVEASFIPMEAISEKYGVPVRYEIKPWGEIKSGFTHFREEDVVLAKITPCFQNGKSAVMRGLKNRFGAGTTELHVYRTINACTVPEYVLIYLKSPQFITEGIPKMTGTAGQKRITRDYFAGNHFPLPPKAEQQRIVSKVDELMALCDALKACLAEAQTTQIHLADAIVERAVV